MTFEHHDSFNDLPDEVKADIALRLVRETCPASYHCDVPYEFSIADLNPGLAASTNVYTREITFSPEAFVFVEDYDPQALLSATYHESMHRGDAFMTRWIDAATEAVNVFTDNHEEIYARDTQLALQYIDVYRARLSEASTQGSGPAGQ